MAKAVGSSTRVPKYIVPSAIAVVSTSATVAPGVRYRSDAPVPYSVGEVAERSGFSIETLRYYERIDLVTDVPRDAGGRRVYDDEHLTWLALLRCLRDTGMPIQEVSRYAALSRQPGTAADRLALLRRHAEAVDAQIALLARQRTHLAEKIEWYEGQLGS